METFIGTKIIKAEKATNRDGDSGYTVEYEDGYTSWSPKEAFEKAYRRTDGLNFGLALEAIKKGEKVARKGWNGKGMYIYLNFMPEADQETKAFDPFITMFTASKTYQPGWLASQADMLADDWEILN